MPTPRKRPQAATCPDKAPQSGAGHAGIGLRRETVLAGLLREAMDEGTGSSQAGRLKAWELLAKLGGFFAAAENAGPLQVHFDIRLDSAQDDTADLPRRSQARNADGA